MNQEKIGAFIARRRKEKKLTQAKLASYLGITDRAVSKWEIGKGLPDPVYMLELCRLLDISVNELLTGEFIEETKYQQKAEDNLLIMAVSSGFEGAESLLKRLFKISADSHNFADGLHLSGQS